MSLLTDVQEFCRRTGLDVPVSLVSSSDKQALQLWGLANEICTDLVTRFQWQDLTEQCTFTSIAAENQGAVATLASSGFLSIIDETIYDRTLRIPIFGPLNNTQWQARQALPATGPIYQYRIRSGHLYFNPAIPAGHTIAFEYKTKNIVVAVDGVTYQELFQADTDSLRLPSTLLTAGLRWMWKKEKGLEYGEELAAYERLVANLSAHDGGRRTLNAADRYNDFKPAIVVPLGNWNT